MGLPPTGRIGARPVLKRACGHQQEFQHYEVDKFRAQRQAKFERTRCADCAAKLLEEQRQAASALPKKGEALKSLPPGTQLSLTRLPDGTWSGTLSADGTTVEATGTAVEGPQAVVVALARLWLTTQP